MSTSEFQIDFVKMTGAGNDFVLIDNRTHFLQLYWKIYAPKFCDRRYGVGADGLIIIEQDTTAPFAMNYYNADGSYGGMCGNGGRCAALYMMDQEKVDEIYFHALDHVYYATRSYADSLQLSMKDPRCIRTNLIIDIHDSQLPIHFIDTGAPHAVFFVDDLPQSMQEYLNSNGINEIGRQVRFSGLFAPAGANVNFVSVLDNQGISLRTYERGVEDETLACGTGSVASALLSALVRGLRSPIVVHTRSKENLRVTFQLEGERLSDVKLEGPARIVFRGKFVLQV